MKMIKLLIIMIKILLPLFIKIMIRINNTIIANNMKITFC